MYYKRGVCCRASGMVQSEVTHGSCTQKKGQTVDKPGWCCDVITFAQATTPIHRMGKHVLHLISIDDWCVEVEWLLTSCN